MTAEGTFPKIDGDILYASEINRFAGGNNFINAGSFIIRSGTTWTDAGSLLFTAGSLYKTCRIMLDYEIVEENAAIGGVKFTCSGTPSNNVVFVSGGPTAPSTNVLYGSFRAQLGSPGSGVISMSVIEGINATDNKWSPANSPISTNAELLNSFNTDSPATIKMTFISAGSATVFYSAYVNGGGY